MVKSSSSLVIGCAPFSSALNLGGVVISVDFGLYGVLKWGFVIFCGVLANGDNNDDDDDDDDCEPYDVPCKNNDDAGFAYIERDENVSGACCPGVCVMFSFCCFSASSKVFSILLYISNAFWAFCSVLFHSFFKFSILAFSGPSTGISAPLLK